jgi:PAS domain S-box-containing protein
MTRDPLSTLAQSEPARLLLAALESTGDAAFLAASLPAAPEPVIVGINPALGRLIGRPDARMDGCPLSALVTGETLVAGRVETQVLQSDGTAVPAALQLRAVDGAGVRWWVGTVAESGLPVGRIADPPYGIERIADAAPFTIYIFDLCEQRSLYVNREITATLGYTPDEIRAMGPALFPLLLHPDDRTRLTAHHQALQRLADGETQGIQYRLRHADGTWRWLLSRDTIFRRDAFGAPIQTLGFAEDITERRGAEAALTLRDRAILSSSNGIAILDAGKPHLPLVFVNSAFEELTGYTSAEVLGEPARFILGGAQNQEGMDALKAALRQGREARIELRNRRKDRTQFWNELHIAPIHDVDGTLTHFVVVQTDITARKEAEEARRNAEERLHLVVQNLPVAVFALDADGVFTFFDGRGFDGLEAALDNPVGRSIEAVYADNPVMAERLRQALAGDRTSWQAEVAGAALEAHCSPLRDHGGQIVGLIGIAMDQTDRVRMQAQMVQSEKLAALGQLVAGVAHEINNPLAAISGHAQLMEVSSDPGVRDDARTIRKMADRATRVVRSLLTFARGHESATRQRRTLRAMAEETLELFTHPLRKAEVQLHCEYGIGGIEPLVAVNGNQIQQIILNLVTNAEHAVRGRHPDNRYITIQTLIEEGEGVLRVADNGSGIPGHLLSRIFDPFFTTKDTGEGTGLGLSICHGIAQAHQGKLEVESVEGVGTTFSLRLPLAPQESCTI